MVFLFVILFWLIIPIVYTESISERINDYFSVGKMHKFQNLWLFFDIFCIRFAYVYFNMVFVSKVIFKLDAQLAFYVGGAIFSFAIICFIVSVFLDWMYANRVISNTVIFILTFIIIFIAGLEVAGLFFLSTYGIIATFLIIKKISSKS